MNTPTPKVKGIVCPKCNGPMRTLKTTHRADRSTQRRKKCLDPKCAHVDLSFERLGQSADARGH